MPIENTASSSTAVHLQGLSSADSCLTAAMTLLAAIAHSIRIDRHKGSADVRSNVVIQFSYLEGC
jgi:hypothetical protein